MQSNNSVPVEQYVTVVYENIEEKIEIEIDLNLVPETSLFWIIHKNSENSDIIKSDDASIIFAAEYVNSKRTMYVDEKSMVILDYWGVYRSYVEIYDDEKFIRMNLYNPKFENHNMNIDPYHKLYNMNKFYREYNEFIELYEKPLGLLFQNEQTKLEYIDNSEHTIVTIDLDEHKYLWMPIKKYNKNVVFLFDIAKTWGVKIFIAGGYVFNNLMNIKDSKSDIDIFFINSNPEQIINYIDVVSKYLNNEDHNCTIRRTKNVISLLEPEYLEYQIILRIYKSYSEVIHGFDIDCCCLGFDGKDVWATERCKYALLRGYNTVNFDLMSQSYEYRLGKYGLRNISIYVPNLENYVIDYNKLDEKYEYVYELENKMIEFLKDMNTLENLADKHDIYLPYLYDVICNTMNEYRGQKNKRLKYVYFKGLDLLLWLNMREQKCKYKNQIEQLCNSVSDYAETSINENRNRMDFCRMVKYLSYDSSEYSEIWDRVYKETNTSKQFFDEMTTENTFYANICYHTVNNFLSAPNKRIIFVEEKVDPFRVLGNIHKIDEFSYKLMSILGNPDFPQFIEFKTLNPSEQDKKDNKYPEATNTFNKLVYDFDTWHCGEFVTKI